MYTNLIHQLMFSINAIENHLTQIKDIAEELSPAPLVYDTDDYDPDFYSLEQCRNKNASTTAEWADILGVSETDVISWESGKNSPSTSTLALISNIIDVPIDHIYQIKYD